MYIPRGNYLTVPKYMEKIGVKSKKTITDAIKQGRIKGSIRIDERTVIIPADAVLYSNSIRTGKYIGVTAFIRGNIETIDEVERWENKQKQLMQMRRKDGDIPTPGVTEEDALH